MGLFAVLRILLVYLTLFNTAVLSSSLETRELGLADIPACGVRNRYACTKIHD